MINDRGRGSKSACFIPPISGYGVALITTTPPAGGQGLGARAFAWRETPCPAPEGAASAPVNERVAASGESPEAAGFPHLSVTSSAGSLSLLSGVSRTAKTARGRAGSYRRPRELSRSRRPIRVTGSPRGSTGWLGVVVDPHPAPPDQAHHSTPVSLSRRSSISWIRRLSVCLLTQSRSSSTSALRVMMMKSRASASANGSAC